MRSMSFLKKLLNGLEVEWIAINETLKMRAGQHISASNINDYPDEEHQYPCFGGNGVRGFVKSYSHDGKYLLIGRQGALCGNIQRTDGKFYATEHAVVVSSKIAINLDWAFHLLTMMNLNQYASQSAQPGLAVGRIQSLRIPIPCPSNPKRSLEIQTEVARILDSFIELTSNLSTEVAIRKKQQNYYYFKMLQFPLKTKFIKIGDCCDLKKGLTAIKKATPGKYPLVATTEERKSSSEYQFDCAAVCVPLISSRGHGVASIDRIYFQEGKFALGNILCAIIPKDNEFLSAKFLRHYLFDKKDVLLVPLMRGGANVSLTVDSLRNIEIPVPPIAEQQRIVRILDKFDEIVKGIPREIKLYQKQYKHYRELLLNPPQSTSDSKNITSTLAKGKFL